MKWNGLYIRHGVKYDQVCYKADSLSMKSDRYQNQKVESLGQNIGSKGQKVGSYGGPQLPQQIKKDKQQQKEKFF